MMSRSAEKLHGTGLHSIKRLLVQEKIMHANTSNG